MDETIYPHPGHCRRGRRAGARAAPASCRSSSAAGSPQRVKTAVNENVNARVDWRDVGLSFFRDFPNLTLTLDDLTAVGVGPVPGRHPRRGPPPPGGRSTCPACSATSWAAQPDRRPRRRARPAAALAHRARGRHRQLGHHQEDRRGRAAEAGLEADGDQPPALRDHGRRHRLRQPPGQAQGVGPGLRPVALAATSARRRSRSRPRPTPTP